ncbi:hypothetical protein OROHE_009681 [Orobanche hederae]
MKERDAEPNNKELYALLHISPEASDEEIRKAYRQWAQVYHPDKYQSPQSRRPKAARHLYAWGWQCLKSAELARDMKKTQLTAAEIPSRKAFAEDDV